MKTVILIICMGSLLMLPTPSGTAKGQPSDVPAVSQEDSIDIGIPYTAVYPGADSAWLAVLMDNHDYYVAGYQFLFTLGSDMARFCETEAGYFSIVDSSADIPPNPGGYQLLLRICMYACCVPDTTTERAASVWLTPGGTSFVWNENGELIPFRYYPGEVSLLWSSPGDANSDSLVAVDDIVFILNQLFRGGSEPCVCEAADANGDCVIDLGDVAYLINYLFKNGPPPLLGCPYSVPCPHEDCQPE